MLALDPRHLARPSCFDRTQEGSYDEWRFQLVAYLAAVGPRFGDVADEVARRTTPHLTTNLPRDEDERHALFDAEYVKTATLIEVAAPQMPEQLRLRWHRLQESDTGCQGVPALKEKLGSLRALLSWTLFFFFKVRVCIFLFLFQFFVLVVSFPKNYKLKTES